MDVPVELLRVALSDLPIEIAQESGKCVVNVVICGKSIKLSVELPEAFPYVFPVISIADESADIVRGIPHRNLNKTLCLFDQETTIPNFKKPVELIEASLRKAVDILESGLLNKNREDFIDEFLAYWDRTSELNCISNVSYGNKAMRLKAGYGGDKAFYVSFSDERCFGLAATRIRNLKEIPIAECLYIPLREPCDCLEAKTQQQWADIMRRSSDYYREYASFLQTRRHDGNLIIFSQPYKGSLILSGFLHNHLHNSAGFRPGKTRLGVAMQGEDGKKDVIPIRIIDISQKRLYERGGVGNISMGERFGIVGCGSLGSHVAEMLTNCGCTNFSFYDNQMLGAENIARHTCGFPQIDMPKTEALKQNLFQHNPNLDIKTSNENIHHVLEHDIASLNANDFLILTVANAPIEYRFAKMLLENRISRPVIIMWVEPYAMAGHALVLNKPQDVFSELFSEELLFCESIVENGASLYKREAGCQATYMPYSGLDIKSFATAFVRALIGGTFERNKNYHFRWIGALSQAERYGIKISSAAQGLQEFTSYVERID